MCWDLLSQPYKEMTYLNGKHEEICDSVNCSIPIHPTHAHNLTDLCWDQQWRESLKEVKKGLPAPEEVEKGLPAPEEVERELGNRENDE